MDRALLPCLTLTIASLLSGCKVVPGEQFNFITVADPETLDPVTKFLRIVKPEIPDGTDPRLPALLIVHGGGWESGDLLGAQIVDTLKDAAERGYVAVTTQYRLTPASSAFRWPAPIQDVKCAIRWMRANADAHNIDPDRIAIAGYSAGGHLAQLAAASQSKGELPVKPAWEATECSHDASSEVNALIAFSGLGDLTTVWDEKKGLRRNMNQLLGSDIHQHTDYAQLNTEAKALIAEINPVFYASTLTAPVLQFHPHNDWVVNYTASLSLHNALVDQQRSPYLLDVDNGKDAYDHLYTGPMRRYADSVMFGWLDHHFKGQPMNMPCGNTIEPCQTLLPDDSVTVATPD